MQFQPQSALHINLMRTADQLFNHYPFNVVLHFMSGWKIQSHNSMTREIHVGIPGDEKFIPAIFSVQFDEQMNITSYGGQHPTIDIGKQISLI